MTIGSRDAERARAKAAELSGAAGRAIGGKSNRDAAAAADLVGLTLPAAGLADTLVPLQDACRGKVVISTVVPLSFGGGRLFRPRPYSPEECRSAAGRRRGRRRLHHIAAQAPRPPAIGTRLLLAADAEAKKVGTDLGSGMGLRAVDVGALTNAGPLEGITAVLATINRRYKLKNSGIKITGLPF